MNTPLNIHAPVLENNRILHGKYRVLKIIKQHEQRNVYSGVYVKGYFGVKTCIIKEGIPHVWIDASGRDMTDRLKWQAEVQRSLKSIAPVPEIIDLFDEEGKVYMVMEKAKGIPLLTLINGIYRGCSWKQIPLKQRRILIDHLLSILQVVESLHTNGYVHRDLTPANFLIDKKGKLTLLDLELMYHPGISVLPFSGGTAGYTSPEQEKNQSPSISDDIYGLGGLMILFFTNMSPLKFYRKQPEKLVDNLYFFTGERRISELIAACCHPQSDLRPSLKEIITSVRNLKENIASDTQNPDTINEGPLDPHTIYDLAIGSVKGLAIDETQLPRYLREEELYQGLQSSIGSVFMVNSFAERARIPGIDQTMFQEFIRYFDLDVLPAPDTLEPGLLKGSAGLGIIVQHMLRSGYLPQLPAYHTYVQRCLDKPAGGLDFANGISGMGWALLQIPELVENPYFREKCYSIHNEILLRQLSNGSWPVYDSRQKSRVNLDLINGVAGILMYLVTYQSIYPGRETKNALQKGLDYLIRRNRDPWGLKRSVNGSLLTGVSGMTWVLLEAYRQEPLLKYKEAAEKLLYKLPAYPMWPKFGLGDGLCGFAWVYLEAAEILGEKRWWDRADHIVRVMWNTTKPTVEGGYFWNVGGKEGDEGLNLLNGNSGIVCFLLKYYDLMKSGRIIKNIAIDSLVDNRPVESEKP